MGGVESSVYGDFDVFYIFTCFRVCLCFKRSLFFLSAGNHVHTQLNKLFSFTCVF
jgi:hypothetical protein